MNATIMHFYLIFLLAMIIGSFFIFSAEHLFAQPSDSTPPAGSIVINNGDESTTSHIVTVTITCEDIFPCEQIGVQWGNADANTDGDSVDVITLHVFSSLSPSGDTFQALETGPNTGFFTFVMENEIFFVDSVPGLIAPEGISWGNGETITIQDFPFSDDEGIKTVSAFFVDTAGNGSSDSDDILLSSSGSGDCTSDDKIIFSVPDTVLSTTRGIAITTNLHLEAPETNRDHVSVQIFIEGTSSNPDFDLAENDFFIDPGETKDVSLLFEVPVDAPLGNYTYHTSVLGEDVRGCEITVEAIDIALSVLPTPDFVISMTPSALSIARGGTGSSEIIVKATDNGFGPLHIEFQAGWNYSAPYAQPVQTDLSFDTKDITLEPGESITRELSIEPAFADDPSLANYIGEFTYTIIAIGTWTDATGSPHLITEQSDLTISAIEEPFDFSLSANTTILFLEPGKTESIELSVNHLSGRHFPVTLSTVFPALGVDAELDNRSGVPDFTSRLYVTSKTPISPRELQVIATGGDKTHTLRIVLSSSPFAIIVDPESTVAPGETLETRVSVIPLLKGYNSTVYLKLSSDQFPTDSLLIEPAQGVVPFDSNLTIRAPQDLVVGDYTVGISGADNELTTFSNHTIHVGAQPPIRIDLEPRLDSLSIDGSPLSSKELMASPAWKIGEAHRLSALPEVVVDESTRYVFDSWSDGVTSPDRVISVSEESLIIVGRYKPQYLLALESQYSETRGAGWHNASSIAEFGLESISLSPSFGIKAVFDGWNGPSAAAVNVPCSSETRDAGNLEVNSYFICMDKPQTLVAGWREDAGDRNTVTIIGTIAAAAGAFLYYKFFKPTNNISNDSTVTEESEQRRMDRKEFPQLRWHIYAPRGMTRGGKAYVDALLENTGTVDVKKIKIVPTTPFGIEYHGGATSIDLILANESKRVSFVLEHTEGEGPFEVTLGLGYEFMTKFVKSKDEKRITLSILEPVLGLCMTENSNQSTDYQILKSRLKERKFLIQDIDTSLGNLQQLSNYDTLLFSVSDLQEPEIAKELEEYVESGRRAIIYADSALTEEPETYSAIAHFMGFISTGLSVFSAVQGFGIKIVNAEHAVVREFYAGDILKVTSQQGHFLSGELSGSAAVLAEHILIGDGEKILTLPALISVSFGEGEIIFINMPPTSDMTIMSRIIERAVLYATRILD